MAVELDSAAFVAPAVAAVLVVAVVAVVVAAADVVVAVVVAVDDDTSDPLEVTMMAIASSFCPVAAEKKPEIAASQTPASNLRLVAAM